MGCEKVKFKGLLFISSIMLCIILLFQLMRMDLLNINEVTPINQDINVITKNNFIDDNTLEYYILFDSKDEESENLKENYTGLLDWYKFNYKVLDVDKLQDKDIVFNSEYIINCVKDLSKLRSMEKIIEYVKSGGKALFSIFPEINGTYYSYESIFGVLEVGDCLGEEGVKIIDPYIFMEKEYTYDYPKEWNFTNHVFLNNDCEVLVSSKSDNPLIWKRKIEKGEIYVGNTLAVLRKDSRGLISGILSHMCDEFIYPITNTICTILEGYATPINSSVSTAIYNNYGLSYRKFLSDILYKNIKILQRDYGVVFTASYLNAINSQTKAPFNKDFINRNDLINAMSLILDSNGEIALEGYNYKPLGLEGEFDEGGWFTPFNNKESMKLSLEKSIKLINDNFNNYTIDTYIPPSSQISETGISVIKEMNNIKTIVSAYDMYWKNELESDFKKEDNIFYIPKTTVVTKNITPIEFSILSSYEAMGIGIIDFNILEGNLDEDIDLEYCFNEVGDTLKKLINKYGEINFLTVSNVTDILDKMSNMKINRKIYDNSLNVTLNDYIENCKFVLKTKRKILSYEGCNINEISEGKYLITVRESDFSIEFQE